MLEDLPNVAAEAFSLIDGDALRRQAPSHPPRILLFYASVRQRSYSRFLTQEAARLLRAYGAETRIFDPSGLPLPDDAPAEHPCPVARSVA